MVSKHTAIDLLVEYGDIDNMLKHIGFIKGRGAKGLIEHADDIPFNRKLATIITNLQIGQDWNDLKINHLVGVDTELIDHRWRVGDFTSKAVF